MILRDVELVMWNLPEGDPPSTELVRLALEHSGLAPERAFAIAPVTAFRRALDTLRSKETLVRTFDRKTDEGKILCAQIDRERCVAGALERERLGIYALMPAGPARINGHETGDMLHHLRLAHERSLATYTWSDVTRVIQHVLTKDGLGAYSPRRAGGVYFAPVNPQSDLLDRIERFAGNLGVRFLRYQVPDSTAQRLEIAEAIHAGLMAELALHQEAIAGYNAETRPRIIASRRERLASTADLINRLSEFLGAERVNDLQGRLREFSIQLDGVEASVAAAAQQRPAGRRIVTVGGAERPCHSLARGPVPWPESAGAGSGRSWTSSARSESIPRRSGSRSSTATRTRSGPRSWP